LFAPIAGHHPQLPLIIDHMGINADMLKQGKAVEGIEATAALAKYPSVSVKLSASANYSLESYPFRDLQPHINRPLSGNRTRF